MTNFGPHEAPNLITLGNLTFEGEVVVHRAGGGCSCARRYGQKPSRLEQIDQFQPRYSHRNLSSVYIRQTCTSAYTSAPLHMYRIERPVRAGGVERVYRGTVTSTTREAALPCGYARPDDVQGAVLALVVQQQNTNLSVCSPALSTTRHSVCPSWTFEKIQ